MQMQFQKELIIRQRQAQLAMQIGLGRERFKYYAAFCGLVIPAAIIGAIVKKNHALLSPVVPLSFMLAFQYDMCYGTMMERAREEADKLIVENPFKFYLPAHSGIVTLEEYEKIIGLAKKK